MEWFGLIAFFMILHYSGKINKIDKLEKKMKKFQPKEKEENEMSKIISELIGKQCIITAGALQFIGEGVKCNVLDVDEEWIKISYKEKKGNEKIKIMRIDAIDDVEIVEDSVGVEKK